MSSTVVPAIIFIVGALFIPLLRGKVRSAYLIALPIIGFYNLINIPMGTHWTVNFLDFQLVFGGHSGHSRWCIRGVPSCF